MAPGLPLALWVPLAITAFGPALLWAGVRVRDRRRPVGVATLLVARTVLTLGLGFAGLVATASLFILRTGLDELRGRHVGDLLPVAQELAAVWRTPDPADAARPVLELYRAAHPDADFTALSWPGCGETCVVVGSDPQESFVRTEEAPDLLGHGDRLVTVRGRAFLIVTSAVRDAAGLPRAMLHSAVDASHVAGRAGAAAWLLTGMSYVLLLVAVLGGRRRLAVSLAERIRAVTGNLRSGSAATPAREAGAAVGRELMELSTAVDEHVRRTVARLREADERYRRLVEHSPDAIVVHDGHVITYANAAAVRLTGVEVAERLQGTPLGRWLRVTGDLPDAGGQGPVLQEGEIRRDDGSAVDVEVAEIPLGGGDGTQRQAVIRDVSDRRRAEEALKRSESLYRELVQQAPLGILRVDVDGRIRAGNPAALRLLGGVPPREVHGVPLADLVGVGAERWRLLHERARSEGRVEEAEMHWRGRDGRDLLVRVTGRALDDARGRYDGLELLVEDVTERRQLEEQLRQAQKMEAVGHLTGGVAHDFNNLLTVILTNVELLKELDTGGRRDPWGGLTEIGEAARRGAALVRKLLAFSRPDTLERRPASIRDVLEDVTSMLRRILPESIRLEVRLPDEDMRVLGDAGALAQILVNLATNARDAMPSGGEVLIAAEDTIVSEAFPGTQGWGCAGPHVRLIVRDTGSGMTPDVQARLFEPFYTTKELGSGTGLGMAIVYSLVRQHEGHIEVSSVPGQGTEVRILLPRVVGGSPDEERLRPADLERCRRGRVLVVEDEEAIRQSTRRLLERQGHEVAAVEHGGHALRMLRGDGRFDLVISDLLMPEVDGRELYDRVRETDRRLPFLFVSGYSRDQVGQFAEDDAAVRFLNKPWELGDFVAAVDELLG